ncbi:MAG: YIP1 family protein [Chloroflexota bacterium]|nr:MAG: YIP1 family protein [Chloroflexota bacterium]
MIVQGVSISEMLNQSVTVLTKPSVATFEQFEKRGGQREAFTYVGVATVIAAIAAGLFGLLGGVGGLLAGLIGTALSVVVGYFVFSYALYLIGKQQGGTGTQDEVFYTTALYIAPIQAVTGVVGAIPFINCAFAPISILLAIYSAYLGYLAARSSMNLDQNKAIISVVVAVVATWLVSAVVIGGLVAMLFGGAAITGALGS